MVCCTVDGNVVLGLFMIDLGIYDQCRFYDQQGSLHGIHISLLWFPTVGPEKESGYFSDTFLIPYFQMIHRVELTKNLDVIVNAKHSHVLNLTGYPANSQKSGPTEYPIQVHYYSLFGECAMVAAIVCHSHHHIITSAESSPFLNKPTHSSNVDKCTILILSLNF